MEHRIFKIHISQKCIFVSLIVLSLLVLISFIISACYVRINEDSVYYLGVTRLILDGKIPYVDFALGYTPLSFYLMCIPCSIFGTSFLCGLVTLYIISLFNAFVVYRIVLRETGSMALAWFGAVIMMLYGLVFDGRYYFLEPFVLAFGLPSVLLLYKDNNRHLLLSGFLCFCAFGCKQYGLGFIFLAIVFILVKNKFSKDGIKKVFWILVGFIVGLCFFVLLLLVQKVPLSSLLYLSGSDYERDGIMGLFGAYQTIFMLIPILIVAILVFFIHFRKTIRQPLLVVSVCGILGFMLQTYVRFYAHYIWLALPFIVFFVISIVQMLEGRYKKLYVLVASVMMIIPVYFVVKGDCQILKDKERSEQEQTAQIIAQSVPIGSVDVFVSVDMMHVLLSNDYTPPVLDKFGMSNGFVRKSEEIMELCRAANICLISERNLGDETRFNSEVIEYLNDRFDKVAKSYSNGQKYFVFKRIDSNK